MKIRRAGTSNSNKVYLGKGADRIIKENLKKSKQREDEEVTKRFLEEYKQKLKRAELSQRNQEVRKINASKIIQHHVHKNSHNLVMLQKLGYKKQRSKSCMNKTDNIFGGMPMQVKSKLNAGEKTAEKQRDARKREKSFVLEMKELKKQIDDEIRREIISGKLEIPSSMTHKRTNMTTINAKKGEQPIQSNKKEVLNMSAFDGRVLRQNNNSKGDMSVVEKTTAHSKTR